MGISALCGENAAALLHSAHLPDGVQPVETLSAFVAPRTAPTQSTSKMAGGLFDMTLIFFVLRATEPRNVPLSWRRFLRVWRVPHQLTATVEIEFPGMAH